MWERHRDTSIAIGLDGLAPTFDRTSRWEYDVGVSFGTRLEVAVTIRYRTMKDLKENTRSVLGEVRRSVVVITNHGKPAAILQPFSADELLALQLLQSKQVRAVLERAMRDARAGRTVPAAAVIERAAARA